MFRSGKREEAVLPVATAPARPVARPLSAVTLDDNEYRAYARSAQTVGFEPAALLEDHLTHFFQGNGINIFPYGEMAAFLAAKAEREGKKWHWRPLRKQDAVEECWAWGDSADHDHYHPRRHECRPYSHAIPLRVLLTVEKIHREFGDRVKFFVTDFAVPRPDPFIAVWAPDIPRFVFDFWDEPDFEVHPTA